MNIIVKILANQIIIAKIMKNQNYGFFRLPPWIMSISKSFSYKSYRTHRVVHFMFHYFLS